ncbi:acyl-CoA synthetase [Nocardia stercoris]|uniref:Acyl-CoA synthetase n=1 Tax=Nocardia stercoris TaxID=2483361 RepID=A0A3M2L136_9NOCA|nr:acyl-CoA synthetase [Nocardia stercoris]RMI31357.1 acyl-CoA synthetase [Nocardia stercoris]
MKSVLREAVRTVGHTVETVRAVATLHNSGVIDLTRPLRLLRTAQGGKVFGPQATLIRNAAQDHPDAPALADERGVLTYRELDEQADALANALLDLGLTPGSVVGVLARDHRGLLLTVCAAGRAGFRLAMLNTGFAEPQFAEVCAREQVRAVLHDSEFHGLLAALPPELPRVLTWLDDGDTVADGVRTIDELIASGDRTPPPAPAQAGGFIILTSGTTGLPKGAPRTTVSPLVSALFVDRIPFPRQGRVMIVSPLFHATGFGMWTAATATAAQTILVRRFDAEQTLRLLAEHRAEMLVAVPTMLNRMVALPADVIARYDLSALRAIVVAGSALSPDLAQRVQDIFGEVLYNLYGSTEVAIAAVAQPAELRRAPGTVGRAPVTAEVALFDAADRRVSGAGVRGRVFVRSGAPFEGYTDGRHKQIVDGFMSTGDMGHFDADGLLFIDGRDDDMIVSGAENVYPLEVENLLTALDGVDEVAVVGVPDPEFGQRLRAVVVREPGAELDADAVRQHVRANLARYKVPRDVLFVPELPRNPTGKVVRRALQELDATERAQ